jgi:hypothetical protein
MCDSDANSLEAAFGSQEGQMKNRTRVSAVVACLVASCGTPSSAQEQEPHSARAYCLKVASKDTAEFESLVRDVGIPVEKSRVQAGETKGFDLLRAVVPLGSSARCDYISVFHYGLLPEAPPGEGLGEAMERAGVDMSVEQVMAQWDALSDLVSLEWWWFNERVGPAWPEGSYVHINHYQLREGVAFGDYLSANRMYWRPIVERLLESGRKVSWDDVGIWRPFRADGYQALTFDVFHDWETMMTHQPFIFGENWDGEGGIWSEVHPNVSLDQLTFHMSRIRKDLGHELFRVVETTTE